MVVHLCCKRLFPMFHLFFRRMFTSVFIWMLHLFHTYVANVLSGLRICCNGFQVLQLLQRYVARVLNGCCKSRSDVAYVAMVVHLCCKRLFPMFHLFLSDVCCECVYLDVAYVSHIC